MIRKINQNDRKEFINMVSEFYSSPAVLHTIPQKNIENTFDNIINDNPYVKGFIIDYDDKIAGYVIIAITYSNEAGGIVIWIEEVYVKANFRGKGIGKSILNQIKDLYPNAKRFRLEVTKDNISAIKLYENLGYENLDYLQMIIDV